MDVHFDRKWLQRKGFNSRPFCGKQNVDLPFWAGYKRRTLFLFWESSEGPDPTLGKGSGLVRVKRRSRLTDHSARWEVALAARARPTPKGVNKPDEPIRPQTTRLEGEAVPGEHMEHVRMELKVCEGCGTLWLRALGHGVYCRRCAEFLADFPSPKGRSRRGRPPRITRVAAATLSGGAL